VECSRALLATKYMEGNKMTEKENYRNG